jgi:hypothetical protein
MCGCRVVDGWVVRHGFCGDRIGGDAGEFLVLVDTEYVAEESVVVRCGLTPCVRDVLNLARKSTCIGLEWFVVASSWLSMYSCDWGGSDSFICGGFYLLGGGRHDNCLG